MSNNLVKTIVVISDYHDKIPGVMYGGLPSFVCRRTAGVCKGACLVVRTPVLAAPSFPSALCCIVKVTISWRPT